MRAGEREWPKDRDEWSLWILLAWGLLLVVAAAVRFRVLDTSLFEDEVWVANLIRHGGWHPHSYSTPPLFYALLRGWSRLRGRLRRHGP